MRYFMFAAVLALVGTSSQTFAIELRGAQIKPVHSDKCLDVSGGSTSAGTQIIQFPCTGGANQKWNIHDTGKGLHEIRAVHSDMCMDVSGASLDNGAAVIQFPCTGRTNQKFLLTALGDRFRIRSVHASKCLDVEGGSLFDNARLIQFECIKQNNNQRFRFK
jgi:cytochrome c